MNIITLKEYLKNTVYEQEIIKLINNSQELEYKVQTLEKALIHLNQALELVLNRK